MDEYRLAQALGNVSDDLLLEAVEVRKKRSGAGKWLRITTVAAVLLLMFGGSLFPNGGNNVSPYFSIYVYANEMDVVELSADGEWKAFSNVNSGNNYINYFDSDITPDDGENIPPIFFVEIMLHEKARAYADFDHIELFCNGEEIESSKLPGEGIFVGFPLCPENTGVTTKLVVCGVVEGFSTIEVILYGEGKEVLQRKSMVVYPKEGGYGIVLYEDYIVKTD